jgi:hypothetical protein
MITAMAASKQIITCTNEAVIDVEGNEKGRKFFGSMKGIN